MMFWALLAIFVTCGILTGVLTGLIPGLHVNNTSLIMLSLAPGIAAYFSFLSESGLDEKEIFLLIAAAIVASTITHTFLDFIPSTFFGAPDPDTALSVLPAHSYLLRGRGYEAIYLSAAGSLSAIFFAALLIIPFKLVMIDLGLYGIIRENMAAILSFVAILLIVTDSRKVDMPGRWAMFGRTCGIMLAATVFLTSGMFGLVVLGFTVSSPFGLPSSILFPVLSGMFGLSTLLLSMSSDAPLPEQSIDYTPVEPRELKNSLRGTVAGTVVGFLPGMSGGIATILSMLGTKPDDDGEPERDVILNLSAVNTANSFFVLIALFLILRPRSGASIVVNELIDVDQWAGTLIPPDLFVFIIVMVFSGLASFYLAVILGKNFSKAFNRFPYRRAIQGIIIFIIVSVFMFCGTAGLVILACSTVLGFVPPALGVRRTSAMGVLLLPVLSYLM